MRSGKVSGKQFNRLPISRIRAKQARVEYVRRLCIEPLEERCFMAVIDLAALVAGQGTTIFGADAGDVACRVSNAGDVNGDGFDDILIGATDADGANNLKPQAGEAYLIFGGPSLPVSIDLATLGAAGITIFGAESGDYAGIAVNGAGDINGDGFDDLIIAARHANGLGNGKIESGESYIFFGKGTLPTTIDLAVPGAAGITIFGAEAFDLSGRSAVSSAGDINGDGFDDLLIGAYQGDASGNLKSSAGDSYIVFGGISLPTTIDLGNLGIAGITIFGVDAGDRSGISVSNAGDVNGDGFDDILIGAQSAFASNNSKPGAGESYLIFGGPSLSNMIDLANLGNAGITIFGVDAGDISGYSTSSAGDVNGDGFGDLLIGATRASGSNNLKLYAGESYLIFGGNSFTSSVTHLGTFASETLTGNAGPNVMVSGRGNDTLISNGGSDVLTGGQGDDILAISDLTFKRIVGGTGNDMLRLDGSGLMLNLTTLSDNRLLGIEQIDISGSGNNTLTLSYRDVLNLSDESNTLVVRRNLGDVINIGSGWTQLANETISAIVFNVYKQGEAVLKIQRVGAASIANRQVFYNRSTSSVFGNGSGNPTNAIDSTKSALLPGQIASFANYTNYVRGLNGLIIDIANSSGTITAADFQFVTWNGINVAGFAPLFFLPTITTIARGGIANTTRIKIEFADNAIRNTWLRVTLLANANTGLASNDVFYFGNAVGDVGQGNFGSPTIVRTDTTDLQFVRNNLSYAINSALVTNIYDLNKDGQVNPIDMSIVQQNQARSLIRFFTAPVSLQSAIVPSIYGFSGLSSPVSFGTSLFPTTSTIASTSSSSISISSSRSLKLANVIPPTVTLAADTISSLPPSKSKMEIGSPITESIASLDEFFKQLSLSS